MDIIQEQKNQVEERDGKDSKSSEQSKERWVGSLIERLLKIHGCIDF